jgi:hypothetical protein
VIQLPFLGLSLSERETMPTKNPRVNITFDPSMMNIVTSLAKELILEALERREDMNLSALAKVRDVKKAKRVKHDDAWE